MTSYKSLINEYKKEFNTFKEVRKHLPEQWLVLMAFLFLATLSLGIIGVLYESIVLIISYTLLIALITWRIHKKITSKNFERIKEYNRKKFIHFITSRVTIVTGNNVQTLQNLLLISNHTLSRTKPGSKIKNGFLITIVSPLLGYIPSFLESTQWNSYIMILLGAGIFMIIGIILMLIPVINFVFNRGYLKEEEFRGRIESLLLNYNDEDWKL